MTLTLAQALGVFQPPACVPGQEMFNDVPASSPFCPFIEELARRGITGGCGGGNFCPSDPVTRQQMAVFLVRAQFPDVVPARVTLRGFWSFDADSDGSGDWGALISYPVPMPKALSVRFRATGSPPTAECPGADFNTPEAAPGFGCVYHGFSEGTTFPPLVGLNTPFGLTSPSLALQPGTTLPMEPGPPRRPLHNWQVRFRFCGDGVRQSAAAARSSRLIGGGKRGQSKL
jgi:hypothetical protein